MLADKCWRPEENCYCGDPQATAPHRRGTRMSCDPAPIPAGELARAVGEHRPEWASPGVMQCAADHKHWPCAVVAPRGPLPDDRALLIAQITAVIDNFGPTAIVALNGDLIAEAIYRDVAGPAIRAQALAKEVEVQAALANATAFRDTVADMNRRLAAGLGMDLDAAVDYTNMVLAALRHVITDRDRLRTELGALKTVAPPDTEATVAGVTELAKSCPDCSAQPWRPHRDDCAAMLHEQWMREDAEQADTCGAIGFWGRRNTRYECDKPKCHTEKLHENSSEKPPVIWFGNHAEPTRVLLPLWRTHPGTGVMHLVMPDQHKAICGEAESGGWRKAVNGNAIHTVCDAMQPAIPTTPTEPPPLRPVYADPSDVKYEYDEDEKPTDPAVRWAIAWGCTVSIGQYDGALRFTVSISDDVQRDGIAVRAVTRQQIHAYAHHLIKLTEVVEDGAP
jgi:hypothetical protein